jgi:phytoene dehydrogenase-like protein
VSRDSVHIVVDGGISGLTTGYALTSAGHTVRLLERAQQFGEVVLAAAVTGLEFVYWPHCRAGRDGGAGRAFTALAER